MPKPRTEANRRAERAYYERNREARIASSMEYQRKMREERREEFNRRSNEAYKRYLLTHPEKKFLWYAKQQINRATGLPWSEIPPAMAEARAKLLAVREQLRVRDRAD